MKRLLVVNPNADTRVTGWLADEVRRTVPPGFAVEAANADSGLAAIETPEHIRIAAAAVTRTIRQADCDAALIGAFGDPGLAEARALGFSVAGLGEAGLRAVSGRFAIVTLGPSMQSAITLRVQAMGLADRLVGLRFLPGRIADYVEVRDARLSEVASEIALCARAGAETVLLGGAPFAGQAQRLAGLGAQVLDGVASAVAEATAL